MKVLTGCWCLFLCCLAAIRALRLDEHDRNRHTYEIRLKKIEGDHEDELGRRIHNAKLIGDVSQFVTLDAVTASNISLKVSGGNRLWTTYYGEIIIGSVEDERNKFKVLFDTGSSELWVPDELCQSEACLTRKRFDRNDGWKAKYDDQGNYVPILIKYLTGEMRAIDGKADVNLMNGIVVKNASVGLATKIDIPILMELPWDGIMGMGFTTKDQISRGATGILEAIGFNSMLYPHFRNQFAYYISKTGGSMTFGGYNNEYKRCPSDEFMWSPVVSNENYWALNLLEITVKEECKNRTSQNRKYRNHGGIIPRSNGIMDVSSSEHSVRSVMGASHRPSSSPIMMNEQRKTVTVPAVVKAESQGNVMDGAQVGRNVVVEDDLNEHGMASVPVRRSSTENLEDKSHRDDDIIYRNSFDDTKIIVDTGTYLIYAPQTMRPFLKTLEVNQCSDKQRLPTIVFTLEGVNTVNNGKVKLELSPEDYVIQFTDSDGSQKCTLGIVVDEQQEVGCVIVDTGHSETGVAAQCVDLWRASDIGNHEEEEEKTRPIALTWVHLVPVSGCVDILQVVHP